MSPGSVVWVEFDDPSVGHEQAGRRPAIVISARVIGSMVIVVPLTRSAPRIGPHIPVRLPDQAVSTALCEQVRAIDRARVNGTGRHVRPDDLAAVRTAVAGLIDIIPYL